MKFGGHTSSGLGRNGCHLKVKCQAAANVKPHQATAQHDTSPSSPAVEKRAFKVSCPPVQRKEAKVEEVKEE